MGKYTVLGLMSGTSMDGLDCGLFNISLSPDYVLDWSCIKFLTYSYSEKIRQSIYNALEGDKLSIKDTDKILGEEFTTISEIFLHGIHIDMIATHGQTIAHNDAESTHQIGDPKFLSEKLQVPVVYNVRQADIDAGGNGAPLMPFLDWLLFKDVDKETITLNLGGVANISYIPKSGKRNEVIGFDTGPGMALIDECCKLFYGEPIDMNGIHAKEGKVNEKILLELMRHDFIYKSPPKSTGRHEFGNKLLNRIIKKYSSISPDDFIRTFCVFTAKSIAKNMNRFLNFNVSDIQFIISGGGVHHPVLMQDIREYTQVIDLNTSDKLGIKSDIKESLLMAVLGVAQRQMMTANMPGATGADQMVVLGDLFN